ncbi:MAG: exonuclease subunit SbcD [Sporomusaceae bacterium]|nr:exonuclease subunit SbcD [Sporomusaceae bacterium]
MRILHTADWHLGKTIEGRDRQAEQEQFVDEICRICDAEKVDLVLLAGDVFQTYNPSAAAEELFYEALNRMAKQGQRAIVVIAGNHDNPERLCASFPLADRLGITLVGLPRQQLQPSPRARTARAVRVDCGPSWLEVAVPGCSHSAVIAALPYPSEGRLRQLVTQTLSETALQQGYNEVVKATFAELGRRFRPDSVNIAMSHLFIRGGIESGFESENQIQQAGGVYAVDPLAFPAAAQYIALGHLHRPQTIASAVPGRYAGSPLAYSFAEAGQTKSVTVVDLQPGLAAAVREVALSAGKPLVKWRAEAGLPQVYDWLETGKDRDAWIDAEIHITSPVSNDEIHKLRSLHDGFVNLRLLARPEPEERPQLPALSLLTQEELFIRFFESRQEGLRPDNELVSLFLELTEELDDFPDQEGGDGNAPD